MATANTEPSAHKESSRTHRTVRRRKSSGLGAELVGDQDVPAFATLASPPRTPIEQSRPAEKPGRRSKRRTIRRALSKWKRTCLRHTWLLPLLISSFIASLYLVNPVPSNPVSAALFLSYPLPRAPGSSAPIQYGKGARDFAFVAYYVIVLSFTREFLMQRVIRPIALAYNIRNKAKQARFLEQFYTAVYFGIFGPFGLYVMSRTPVWYFNTRAMYEGFPHRTHEAVFKAYYLLQASYWAQQMIVLLLMLEKPRKDFKELVAHHFITLALIWCSYRFHFTYMGIAVYITMDVSDFFLATSKVLNYLDSPIVPPYFGLFMCVWFYMRHYLNLRILYSILTEFATVGPYELNWQTQQYKCWIAQVITFALLAALQAVNMFWGFLVVRIAWRMVVLKVAEDERSEYESDGEEEGGRERGVHEGEKIGEGLVGQGSGVLLSGEKANGQVASGLDGPANGAARGLRLRSQE
ncbi:longevity assurance proteins LAG1/LAC1 [Lophiostoma macrostomum CBS 122681]|uniref:Longevity assurance proteins LAG1/LAC1 n=1 Tax=Lophiostoma macrostomum CBS 122681 TaxID=1314788 RepID=A0A6A6TMH0_9PLEO|nr:longevity assurance proteins LAG1/LAC1 [Lophiostoma macrostomum CBS 122681]